MVSATRAAAAHSHGSVHGSVRRSEVRKSPDRIRDLARSRISSHRSFADQHPEWKESPSKGQNIPQWIKKRDDPPTEVQRNLFRHSSGREYEIGIWATGHHRNLPALEEIRSKLLPNLQQALRQQRMPVGVTAIKAAMMVAGRLPLYKIVHKSLKESFEFHACISSQPKNELDEVYQAFDQQVKEKVDMIEEDIRRKKQKEKAYFDRHGYTEEEGWEAIKYLNNKNKEMDNASGKMTVTWGEVSHFLAPPASFKDKEVEITVTKMEDAQFQDPPPSFSLPDHIQQENPVKINSFIFKHKTGNIYEVGVWAYPQSNALETMLELLRQDSSLKDAMEGFSASIAKELSATLALQHKPYSYLSVGAASQVAGKNLLCEETILSDEGDVELVAFVCRQPVKEVEEVQQAFEKQIKEAIPKCTIQSPFKLRLERYICYRRETLVGSPPDYFMEGKMLWQDRIKETERLLEWSEEDLFHSKRLKWLIEWESGKDVRSKL